MDKLVEDRGSLGFGSSRAYRFVSSLVWLYGAFTVVIGLALCSAALTSFAPAAVRAQALETIGSGEAGLVLSTLLMAVTMLCAAQAMAAARIADVEWNPSVRFSLRRIGPGPVARQGQAIIIVSGAVVTCFLSWRMWPAVQSAPTALASPNILGALAIAVAFFSLIGERMMAEFSAVQMPEAPALRRALLIVTVLLAAAGALEIARGAGLLWVRWLYLAAMIAPWIVAAELSLRALGRLFLPAPRPSEATAVVDSLFIAALSGGPRAPGALIREQFGIDFTRSWALSYLMSAALPALVATALLCWGLSGLKLVGLSERGIYERFGAPVAVLGPGIHLLLPWPMGILRPVEFGTLHEIKVASNAPDSEARIPVEAIPPASTNHLWDTAVPTEAEYLVASESQGGAQGFQAVDAEIHVVYRTGLTAADAMQAVYGAETDPATLVSEASSRVVSRYFASHTLEMVMGAQRDALAESLRAALAQDIAAYHAGIEIVSVHIESVHPPAGAAAAYHQVQAAEINAKASVFNETARAKRMAGVADQEAHELITAAQASADEKINAATADAYLFNADRKAYAEGQNSFMMERTFAAMISALRQVRLTIVDNRLTPAQAPVIDLRPTGTPAPPESAPAAPAGAAAPATPAANAPAPPPPASLTPGVEVPN